MIPSAAGGATAIEVAVAIAVAITEPSPPSSVTKEKSKSSSSYSSNIDLPFVRENSLTVRHGTYTLACLVSLLLEFNDPYSYSFIDSSVTNSLELFLFFLSLVLVLHMI